MSSEPREYLHHFLVEADYLLSRRTGLKFEDFVADDTLRRANFRSLEIIWVAGCWAGRAAGGRGADSVRGMSAVEPSPPGFCSTSARATLVLMRWR